MLNDGSQVYDHNKYVQISLFLYFILYCVLHNHPENSSYIFSEVLKQTGHLYTVWKYLISNLHVTYE